RSLHGNDLDSRGCPWADDLRGSRTILPCQTRHARKRHLWCVQRARRLDADSVFFPGRLRLRMTSVDVVVPCYNYARYLEDCVNSVLSQRDVDLRVLIIDDASPDNTPTVAKRLAATDRRVTYMRNDVNLGLVGTSNRGVIDWACAEYTALISADD